MGQPKNPSQVNKYRGIATNGDTKDNKTEK